MTGAGVEGLEAEIVENEKVGSTEGLDEARMAPVAPSKRQALAELRPAMIEDRPIVATGFLADGAGQPALADAGRPDQSEIVVGVDPFALRELLDAFESQPDIQYYFTRAVLWGRVSTFRL